jgi:UDP-glucose 4-epimerase
MANYIVTGAAGFIGSSLAQKLIGEGHYVVTIDNLSTGFKENIPDGVDFIQGDCGDAFIYEKLPNKKYEAIFHIAGQSSGEISFDDPIYDIRTNAESTLLLLKYALKNQCQRFIYAGTMSVYGIKSDHAVSEEEDCTPQSFYGVAKLASEHYMRIYQQYGINSTSLRLFNVYGPGQNMSNLRQGMVSIFMAQMIKNNHVHIKGSKSRFRDFVYIDDVVESFVRCLTRQQTWGESINIAAGRKTTVNELIGIMLAEYNKKVTIDFLGSTKGDIHGIWACTKKMKDMLGIEDVTKLEDGLNKMLLWSSKAKRN